MHQAGHWLVARHFGVRHTQAWIYPRQNVSDDVDEVTWLGHFQMSG
jgi:hypothetical protein